jgi:hypothetical protein
LRSLRKRFATFAFNVFLLFEQPPIFPVIPSAVRHPERSRGIS